MKFALPTALFRTRQFFHRNPKRRFVASRRLFNEALESRFALTAEIGFEAPAPDTSLAHYIAQTQEMGPVAPAIIAPPAETVAATEVVDAQSADAVFTALVTNPAAEGEDVVPAIVDFHVSRSDGWVYVTGRITDDDPMNCYVMINGPQFLAEYAGVGPSGYFSIARADEGMNGEIFASAYDFYGNGSQKVSAWLM